MSSSPCDQGPRISSSPSAGPLARLPPAGRAVIRSVTVAKAGTQAATLAALLEKPEDGRWEIVDGELTTKEAASGKHGSAQGATFQLLRAYRRRSGGPPSQPDGRWFASEALVEFSVVRRPQNTAAAGWSLASEALVAFSTTDVRCPDIPRWRRERPSEPPDRRPISVKAATHFRRKPSSRPRRGVTLKEGVVIMAR